jgi:membrane protease YdiL (CAAX protease family)
LFALYHGPTQGFAPSKLAFYLIVGIVFGTIAYMTRSTLPALPVHVAGDLLFFLVIWPGDAGRSVVWSHGTDLMFWANALQVLVFGILAVLAFLRLRAMRSSTRRGQPTPASPPDLGGPLVISPQSFTGHSS